MLLVPAVGLFLQTMVFSALMAVFFTVFGLIAVPETLARSWAGRAFRETFFEPLTHHVAVSLRARAAYLGAKGIDARFLSRPAKCAKAGMS